jgi:gas vesicle protein
MMNFKVLLCTLTGLIVGAGIGVLLAPYAGSETRSRMACALGKLRASVGLDGEEEFSDSEMEMDARSSHRYGF